MSHKNQSNVQFFNPNKLSLQEEPDGASFISLLLCSAGMFMRNKIIIWLSIFLILSTMCRKKYSSPSTQYLVNGVMIVFALVSNYVLHPPQSPQWSSYHINFINLRNKKSFIFDEISIFTYAIDRSVARLWKLLLLWICLFCEHFSRLQDEIHSICCIPCYDFKAICDLVNFLSSHSIFDCRFFQFYFDTFVASW